MPEILTEAEAREIAYEKTKVSATETGEVIPRERFILFVTKEGEGVRVPESLWTGSVRVLAREMRFDPDVPTRVGGFETYYPGGLAAVVTEPKPVAEPVMVEPSLPVVTPLPVVTVPKIEVPPEIKKEVKKTEYEYTQWAADLTGMHAIGIQEQMAKFHAPLIKTGWEQYDISTVPGYPMRATRYYRRLIGAPVPVVVPKPVVVKPTTEEMYPAYLGEETFKKELAELKKLQPKPEPLPTIKIPVGLPKEPEAVTIEDGQLVIDLGDITPMLREGEMIIKPSAPLVSSVKEAAVKPELIAVDIAKQGAELSKQIKDAQTYLETGITPSPFVEKEWKEATVAEAVKAAEAFAEQKIEVPAAGAIFVKETDVGKEFMVEPAEVTRQKELEKEVMKRIETEPLPAKAAREVATVVSPFGLEYVGSGEGALGQLVQSIGDNIADTPG